MLVDFDEFERQAAAREVRGAGRHAGGRVVEVVEFACPVLSGSGSRVSTILEPNPRIGNSRAALRAAPYSRGVAMREILRVNMSDSPSPENPSLRGGRATAVVH